MTLKRLSDYINADRIRIIIQLETCSYNSEYSFNLHCLEDCNSFDEFVLDHKNYIVEFISANYISFPELLISVRFPSVYDEL